MSTNTKKTKKTRPICLPIQKRQRKPDRYVYQYKKDKENQTDMSTNTKKTKKTRPICLPIQKRQRKPDRYVLIPIQKRQRKPDRYVYQYKKDKENQTDLSTNTKKTKKTRPICLPIGDIGGVKDDMKEYSDQFLKSNPQNNTVEENWANFKVTLIEAMKKHIPQKKISSRWNLPWITTEIKKLIRKKRRAYNAGKKKKNGDDI